MSETTNSYDTVALTPVQKAREYLGQLKKIQRSIDNKLEHIRLLRGQTTSITATIKPDVVQSSSSLDAGFANTINAILDLEGRIHVDIYKQIKLRNEIMERLDNMSMEHLDYVNILEMFYVNSIRLEQIACELKYAYPHVKRLKARAERIFFEYM